MKISITDASNYFKGLLLLIRKDNKITQQEAELMRTIGKTLGFEKEFCDNAIHEILDNNHIDDVPPLFSTKELAAKFIKDGLSIALSDNELHPKEIEWLKSTVEKNGLDTDWFTQVQQNSAGNLNPFQNLEAYKLTVKY